jgi:hippurate hydrolase
MLIIRVFTLTGFLICILCAFQNPTLPPEIRAYVNEDLDFLVGFYKQLHRHPELSLKEEKTSRRLADELRKAGFEVTERFGGYGIVAMLRNGDGPLITYRTDMDALPITENTGLEYASTAKAFIDNTETGVMHACGHDIHMSSCIGVARTMAKFRDHWSGTLMIIGQPAEEVGLGAKMMLEAGLYEQFGVPEYVIAFHTNAALPAGHIGIDPGFTMANAESVDIIVHGIGAHGAQPHRSIDPIVVASMIVLELQTIVSRNLKPTDAAVVTVGMIQGGVKNNIIPDQVVLKLTIRSFTEEVRQMIHRRIREIARGVAVAAGLPEDKMPEVKVLDFSAPANYNNPDLVERLRASAINVIDANNIKPVEPQTVAEDFALYGRTEHQVPTVLFWLGTVPEKRVQSGEMPGLHTPYYYPDPEVSLLTGVLVTTQMLLDLFEE